MCRYSDVRASMVLPLALFFLSLAVPAVGEAATYVIRPDGGAADKCTGLVDAPYPGVGVSQPCAWSHPFWALDAWGTGRLREGIPS
jgi:hypothetical protein